MISNLNNHINKVYNKDILEVLRELPDNSLDVVYGDPDYNVGINYAGKNYTKKWDEYIDWYIELTKESMRVLKDEGNLFMMNYPKQNAYLRVRYLDDNSYQVNDYVWVYNSNIGLSKRKFTTAHRSILHATKSKDNNFYKDNVALPYLNPNDKRIKQRMEEGSKGRMPYSWFYFDLVKNLSPEKTFHSCQIPLDLTEMLIKSSSNEGDNVLILFGGSGNEIFLCNEIKRNYISTELHEPYYNMIQERLENDGKVKNEHLSSIKQKS